MRENIACGGHIEFQGKIKIKTVHMHSQNNKDAAHIDPELCREEELLHNTLHHIITTELWVNSG